MTAPVAFDHHSPEYAGSWPALYARLHAAGTPVARSSAHGGMVVAASYSAVERVLKDNATFSSRHDVADPDSPYQGIVHPPHPIRSTPIELDPPEFHYYRKALNPSFSPAVAASWEPWLRDVTTALLDDAIETGRMDVVDGLASPLPALLTARLLGLPLSDWRTYSDAAHNIVAFPMGSPECEAAQLHLITMLGRALEVAVDRRTNPKDDLLSVIVGLEEDGAPLSDQRIVEIATLVIAGGNDTTTSLIAGALHHLSSHPEQRARLAADPKALSLACEEYLRVFSPVQAMARTATCPVRLGDVELEPGDRVLVCFAGANRDPGAFPDPDDIVLDRYPNRHAAFGLGIHRCLGSNFARVAFRIAIEEVLRRMPDFVVDTEQCVPYACIGTVNGWHRMPMSFSPGLRLGSGFALTD